MWKKESLFNVKGTAYYQLGLIFLTSYKLWELIIWIDFVNISSYIFFRWKRSNFTSRNYELEIFHRAVCIFYFVQDTALTCTMNKNIGKSLQYASTLRFDLFVVVKSLNADNTGKQHNFPTVYIPTHAREMHSIFIYALNKGRRRISSKKNNKITIEESTLKCRVPFIKVIYPFNTANHSDYFTFIHSISWPLSAVPSYSSDALVKKFLFQRLKLITNFKFRI